MSFKEYDAGCRVHDVDHKQKLTLAFHMVMVAVSPGGTRMMGVPFTILLLCCGAAACWSDLQAVQQMWPQVTAMPCCKKVAWQAQDGSASKLHERACECWQLPFQELSAYAGCAAHGLHSMLVLHSTFSCAFRPGCLIGHAWLHTVDCEVLHGKKQIKVEKESTSAFETNHNTTQYNSNNDTKQQQLAADLPLVLGCEWGL